MIWRLEISSRAQKQLAKLDKHTARIILAWLKKNVDGCDNPRATGKPLTANLAGAWRYRIGNYRVLCEIQDAKMVVLALEIGHRREIYTSRN